MYICTVHRLSRSFLPTPADTRHPRLLGLITWEDEVEESEVGSGDNGSEDELEKEGGLRVPLGFLQGRLQRAFRLGKVGLVRLFPE